MRKILMIAALLLVLTDAYSQQKVLRWDELMDYKYYPQRSMRGFVFKPETNSVMYTLDGVHWLYDGVEQRELTYDEEEYYKEQTKPAVEKRAKVKDGDLYVDNKLVDTADGYNVVLGESVHRNEFGIEGGLFWSPKGNRLAFYRMDQSMVKDYPIVNTAVRQAEERPIKYPMAGMKSHEVTVGVYNCMTLKLLYLQTRKDNSVEEREMYLTNIAWSPDEKHIYLAKINRAQNHLWFERYSALTGKLEKVLFEETNDRYVEPVDAMIFTPQGDRFLWYSMRDGYKHLYLYTTEGKLIRQVTKGQFEVEGFIGFDKSGENIFVYANKDNPIGRDAYRVNLNSGKMECLTAPRNGKPYGTHSIVLNDEGTHYIDAWSSVEMPYRVDYRSVSSKGPLKTLFTDDNPLEKFAQPSYNIGTIKAADGRTDLYYRLITPPAMKAGEKYPTLVYVYGGPHSQLVTDSWMAGANLYFTFLAQHGYVVFTLDNRGTDNRGFDFESCTHRHLGQIEMADQLEGVRYLKTLPFVDADRMGVEGWSFGGFMTITMKLAHPEIFKVGCAGGPVIDWKWYEIMYGERYMDTPQENPDGYEQVSLLEKAKYLDGKLLIIHGCEDNTVVWQHSLEFVERCINNLKQVDYFVYPHHEHNVRGRERTHLYKKMFDYYEDYLKTNH